MRNIKLTIEYEGTNYAGWQVQRSLPSIQGTIEEKIRIITGEDARLTASGRTDAGVHAIGQVANFFTDKHLPPHSFQMGLNALLPEDIAIKKAEEASPDFDSRKSARSKIYKYLILNRSCPSAIHRNFSWHVFQRLDIDAMRAAAVCLIGKKDFTSFRAAECDAAHPIREILAFSIKKEDDGFLEFEVKGTAFLRHMVRIIAGTLVAVGKGKIAPADLSAIIEAKDRRLAGMTAPPQGLFLKEVEY